MDRILEIVKITEEVCDLILGDTGLPLAVGSVPADTGYIAIMIRWILLQSHHLDGCNSANCNGKPGNYPNTKSWCDVRGQNTE